MLPACPSRTLSDLLPLRHWKKTRLYNEFFVELGMQEQLGASFPFAFPDLMGVVISRTRRTFTQRDRLLLDVVRLHASEAFRTARWQVPAALHPGRCPYSIPRCHLPN